MQSVTIRPGRDKTGKPEPFQGITLERGELCTIVGNTGSGKSRFIKDVEQLAHGDSVTRRRVFLDGVEIPAERRQSLSSQLVAHLGQNMRFVLDASVEEFLALHAQCRGKETPPVEVLALANEITPEPVALGQSLNQLSGGQSRALMIADIALLCDSPIVLIDEIEKSKQQDLSRLLCAFGIRQVGQKAAKVLARTFGSMDAIENATPLELTAVDDIGPITAESVVSWAQNPQTQHQIHMLREAGVNMLSREERRDNRFLGKTFVLTGTLTKYTRDEASAIVESFGGKASSSVSKKTSYVLAGEAAGSKLDKARTLGIPVITEDEFEEMIR